MVRTTSVDLSSVACGLRGEGLFTTRKVRTARESILRAAHTEACAIQSRFLKLADDSFGLWFGNDLSPDDYTKHISTRRVPPRGQGRNTIRALFTNSAVESDVLIKRCPRD